MQWKKLGAVRLRFVAFLVVLAVAAVVPAFLFPATPSLQQIALRMDQFPNPLQSEEEKDAAPAGRMDFVSQATVRVLSRREAHHPKAYTLVRAYSPCVSPSSFTSHSYLPRSGVTAFLFRYTPF